MSEVITGNRTTLQFKEDDDLNGYRRDSVPSFKPLNEKIKTLTKKYAEDVQKRLKNQMTWSQPPKSSNEVIQKMQGDTVQLVVDNIVGSSNAAKPDAATVKKVQDSFKLATKEEAERVLQMRDEFNLIEKAINKVIKDQ
jgi:hypothetical protein